MEDTNAQTPKPNEFIIPEDEAYAMTDMKSWEVIDFLMGKLEPVDIESLDPEDRLCTICRQEYQVCEDVRLSHPAIKTTCGHVFGKYCLIKWLDPLCCWGITDSAEPLDDEIFTDIFERARASCPTCRQIFFRETCLEPMESLAVRLWLWDHAYNFAGIAWSEKEERTRERLWEFVLYCRSINQFTLDDNVRFELIEGAQSLLVDFAKRLKAQCLTRFQEGLRQTLAKLAEMELRKVVYDEGDGSHISFVFEDANAPEPEPADVTMKSSDGEDEEADNKERKKCKVYEEVEELEEGEIDEGAEEREEGEIDEEATTDEDVNAVEDIEPNEGAKSNHHKQKQHGEI